MMKIRDYELIKDITEIYKHQIIIYGAGNIGTRICELLQNISIKVSFFCDQNGEKENINGIPMISFAKLKEITRREECIIILGSHVYCQEMYENLDENNIRGYIYTWYGVQAAIELNIDNNLFSNQFRKDYLERKELLFNTFYGQYLFHIMHNLARFPEAVFIYQPGKVGSATIQNILKNANIPCVHFHWLETNIKKQYEVCCDISNLYKRFSEILHNQINKRKQIKIITLVRDPIAKELSEFMQRFMYDFVDPIIESNNLEEEAKKFVVKRVNENIEFEWFNTEIKTLTGIDIFEYPFDREKGYSIIKKNNVEILVLKTEKLNENIDVLASFLNEESLQMIKGNVGEEKHYKFIYKELKSRFELPKDFIYDLYKKNSYVDFFYTKEEKEIFVKKWSTK